MTELVVGGDLASTYVLRPRLGTKGCPLISECGKVGDGDGDTEDEQEKFDEENILSPLLGGKMFGEQTTKTEANKLRGQEKIGFGGVELQYTKLQNYYGRLKFI